MRELKDEICDELFSINTLLGFKTMKSVRPFNEPEKHSRFTCML